MKVRRTALPQKEALNVVSPLASARIEASSPARPVNKKKHPLSASGVPPRDSAKPPKAGEPEIPEKHELDAQEPKSTEPPRASENLETEENELDQKNQEQRRADTK